MVKKLVWVMIFLPFLSYGQDFYHQSEQGWYWYDEKQAENDSAQPQPMTAELAQAELEALKKDLQNRKALAVMYPTEDNIKSYVSLQYEVNKKAELFSKVWERVIIKNPELDHSLKNPSNNQARKLFKKESTRQRDQQIKAFTDLYGMFFFFRSDCSYCHQFAPTLKMFEEQYGVTLIPVSLDGKGLPEYPDPKMDNGIAKKFNIDIVPSVIAVEPQTGEIIPVTHGLISLDELSYRIDLMSQNKDQNHP